jgi:ribosomal protein S18 acetylase RimI-like enzyme
VDAGHRDQPPPLSSWTPRSIAIATDLDVLPARSTVSRRDDYTVVRSPSNPAHYWGNFLVFDDPPGVGDGERWEALFEREFADEQRVRHRAFSWDRIDGAAGRAREELVARGYELDDTIGLAAESTALRPHPRANRDVVVRALDPDADEELWAAVIELQVADRDEGHDEADYRAFARARLGDRLAHFRARRGAWYVALHPETTAPAASCGIVVTNGRGRFQVVDTAAAYRRQGIASRLLVDAARHATAAYGAERFVIVADVNYHALGLYESLGFTRAEHVLGAFRRPQK